MKHFHSHPAIVTLTTMIVIGFVSISIVLLVILSSVDILQQGIYDTEYQKTFVGADACAEEVLLRLNSDHDYAGDAFTIGTIACTASVTDEGSGVRTIRIVATQGAIYIHTLELTVNVNSSPIAISNWEEVL